MPDLEASPLNREPDAKLLISSFITVHPVEPYDRNHSCIPRDLDASTHHIHVDGLISKPVSLSISDLRDNFAQHEITSALQCAGNRRHAMRMLLKEVQGIDWGSGAVMNYVWRGPRVRDILLHAGLRKEDRDVNVAFACNAVPCQDASWFGSSISLGRALREDADVILALEMNGERLTQEHGFPVRALIPGVAGARSVKWLDHITVQHDMSSNHYMHFDYKALPEQTVDSESAKQFWRETPPVIDTPVNSVVVSPEDGSTVETDPHGYVAMKGYAISGGDDGPIVKVEVSTDGETWSEAQLLDHERNSKWTWKLWEARVKLGTGDNMALYSRATDKDGNTQPRHSAWNLRGVCYNGYGEVRGLAVRQA